MRGHSIRLPSAGALNISSGFFFSFFFRRFQLTFDPVVIIMTETASAALPGANKSAGSANFSNDFSLKNGANGAR
jgi:hypothetical protein